MKKPREQSPPKVVSHRRVRCPACGSLAVKVTRTIDLPDCGIIERYSKCQTCRWTFKVIAQ